MLPLFINLLLAIHILVSVLIILIVLMQRPKSEGLGAAFGGGMTENLFGAQTTNVLANATRWLGGTFFLLTLLLSILYAHQSMHKSSIQAGLIKAAAAATPAPLESGGNGASMLTGTSALSGTEALSGTASDFGAVDVKLGAPASTPASALLPAATLGATPAASGSSAH
jgi:preprotein translocase subunit SecG